MAELTGKAISELPESTTVNNSALVALSENGASKKMTLLTLIGNLLKKTGDTMTGALGISSTSPAIYMQNTSMDVTDTSYTATNGVGVRLRDKNGKNVCIVTDRYMADGRTGLWLSGWKTVDGTDISNSLHLFVDKNGNREVLVSDGSAWRKALNLCYAANDTFSALAGNVTAGIATSTSTIYFCVNVPKSMENISTITPTTLKGYLCGPDGKIDNTQSTTDLTASPYSITVIKVNDYTVRFKLDKSSAFTNLASQTPVNVFIASMTLKFT